MVNLLKIGIQQPSCRTTLEPPQVQMSFPVWGFIIILSFRQLTPPRQSVIHPSKLAAMNKTAFPMWGPPV